MLTTIKASIFFIKNADPLKLPTEIVKNWLNDHPAVFKIALIANHLFRTAMMTGFMLALPFTPFVNGSICVAGTLFYRLTIQGVCPYKLDVSSLFGAFSVLTVKDRLPAIISGIGSRSLAGGAAAFLSVVPLAFYAFYIVITSEKKCCHS